MPYKISWEDHGVVVQFSGIFDFEVNKNANIAVWEDPRSNSIRYVIWDASAISELLATESEFSILAMQDHVGSLQIPNIKLGLFTKEKQTRRLFEYYAINYHSRLTGWEICVFDSMEALRSWIAS